MLPGAAEVVPEVEADGFEVLGGEGGLELGEQGAGGFGADFVLHDDVGLEALAILWGEMIGEGDGELPVEVQEFGCVKGVGYAAAEGAQASDRDAEGRLGGGGAGELGGDGGVDGKGVEEGDVGVDKVEGGRIVGLAETVEAELRGGVEAESEDVSHAVDQSMRGCHRVVRRSIGLLRKVLRIFSVC